MKPNIKHYDIKWNPSKNLELPLRLKMKPRRIFVDGMTDFFHDNVSNSFIKNVFSVIETAGSHSFQILTKRPERMISIIKKIDDRLRYAGGTDFSKKILKRLAWSERTRSKDSGRENSAVARDASRYSLHFCGAPIGADINTKRL